MKVIEIFGLSEWKEADVTIYGKEEEQIYKKEGVLCEVPVG